MLLVQLGCTEQPGLWPRLAQHWYRGIPVDAELEAEQADAQPESRGPAIPLGSLLLVAALVMGLAGAAALA